MNIKNQENWHQLVDALPQGVMIINVEGKILYVNTYAAELFSQSQSKLTGTIFLYPLAQGDTQEIEIFKSKNELLSIKMTVRKGAWQDEFAWIVSLENISQYKMREKRLSIASKGIESAFDGIIITDEKGTVLEANQAFYLMTGYTEREVIGNNTKILYSGRQNEEFYLGLWHDLLEKGQWSGEVLDKGKGKTLFPVYLSISAIKNIDGDTTNYIGIYHDLTVIKKQEMQIESMRIHDPVTGLINQFYLIKKLKNLISKCSEFNKELVLLNIGIFSKIEQLDSSASDTEQVTDKLLLEVVMRMERSSYGKVLLSRVGYKEFVIVYFSHKKLAVMGDVAQRIIDALSKPYQIDNKQYLLQSVIGLSGYFGSPLYDPEYLLTQSEIARHKARQLGVNTYAFYNPTTEKKILEFNQQIAAIRNAIKFNQLELYYQPQIDMQSEQPIGVEALLRWNHPDQGLLDPSQFLFNVDDHPIALELGEWVLDHALQQVILLSKNKLHVPISINISAYQLQHKDFLKNLDAVLSRYPLAEPNSLIFEILETAMLEDLELISQIIKECKFRGILFALDDFGTGYSSLTFLQKLDAMEIKIDQSFVRNSIINPKDIAILKTTIHLCRLIGRTMVAEGVETMTHAKLLFHLGCTLIQGYAVSKPIPKDNLISWLKKWKFNPVWKKYSFSKDKIDNVITLITQHHLRFESIKHYLESSTIDVPDLNPNSFLLEQWIIKHKFKDQTIFAHLHELHQQEHVMALELIEISKKESKSKAYEKLKKLYDLHNKFLNAMMGAILAPF